MQLSSGSAFDFVVYYSSQKVSSLSCPMINETYRNVLFGTVSIVMLFGSIKHSEYLTGNMDIAEKYYYGMNLGLVITCLFANVCLGIFSIFILGNLNDFMHRMCVNLIGAGQKLRVLAILMLISMALYSAVNFTCLMHSVHLSQIERKMVTISAIVVLLQLLHLLSIYLLHSDVFGLKWMGEVQDYDKGRKSRVVFL